MTISRRTALSMLPAAAGFAAPASAPVIGFGLGAYGLAKLPIGEAISLVARTGYDSIELALMPGYPTDPANTGAQARREIRDRIRASGLALPSLLEQVFVTGDDAAHRASLERLKRGAQFGHDVKPGHDAPMVQTHLGGKAADWDRERNRIVDRLGDWVEVGRATETTICIKGHNLNLMDTSERTAWVMRQFTGKQWLNLLYDYSHFQAAGENLATSLSLLLPFTALISIKDGRPAADGKGFERLLPGDGTVDYLDYYRRLVRARWSGHTVVEISGQIHSRPGYDPIATARHCYANIAPVMAKAGALRPSKAQG